MRSRHVLIVVAVLVVLGIIVSLVYFQTYNKPGQVVTDVAPPVTAPSAAALSPSPGPSPGPSGLAPSPVVSPVAQVGTTANVNPDLTIDVNGLSRATVVITTSRGVIKFKFYPKDAPDTVKRMIELINQKFYNGLTFHRVVPGFVVQGGDPQGTGVGGSGQHLKAEFNDRRHTEGTVAMARAADPDSADSQFYFTLSAQPHLDHLYTVFGQVIEAMDVIRKLQVGDKMISVTIQ